MGPWRNWERNLALSKVEKFPNLWSSTPKFPLIYRRKERRSNNGLKQNCRKGIQKIRWKLVNILVDMLMPILALEFAV